MPRQVLAELENFGAHDVARGEWIEPYEIVVTQGCQKPMNGAFPDPQLGADFGQSTSILRAPKEFNDIQSFDERLYRIPIVL
jgi:hypothetical protein